jgi:hypothetical protein
MGKESSLNLTALKRRIPDNIQLAMAEPNKAQRRDDYFASRLRTT